ncbi:MAG: TIGR00266 family protein [Planctomycetota bacterium]|nr:MAG: TIGR00266 family protein [Planctomycetota bacterium]
MSQKLEYKFFSRPDYGFLIVNLQAGQSVQAEASVMASMDTNIRMKTSMKGGLMQGLKRKFLTGESLFINEFTAEGGPGEVTFAPGAIGDIEHYYVEKGKPLYLQSSAYVASSLGVNLNTKWEGFRGFFSGMGLFLIKVEGEGDVFFNGYGALVEIPVDGSFVVDTGCIAAFESSLQYKVEMIGGLKTTILGGEGLVCHFRGQGKVWIQTRNVPPFADWLWPFRPVRNND